MDSFGHQPRVVRPQAAMFKAFRRLHAQNLENQGLNNFTEAFQSFVTRAKFFGIGNLRRTWSHSAVEFMKYRRLLPQLVADEHDPGSVFDDFSLADTKSFSARGTKSDERKITVTNVPGRATSSQLQSFFGKFGKVQSVHIPSEDRRQSVYATMPKPKKTLTAHITFKTDDSARKAKVAPSEELTFYGQVMNISTYVSRRRTTSIQGSMEGLSMGASFTMGSSGGDGQCSRSSSVLSLSSESTSASQPSSSTCLDDLPSKALERVFTFLSPIDRIRLERVNKSWLEAAAKSWTHCCRLSFCDDEGLRAFFGNACPLRNAQLKAFLMRCGIHLTALDVSGVVNLLDDKSVENISQLCPNLTELDLTGVRSSEEALRSLSESLPKLTQVAYREMRHSSEKAFWFLFKSCGKNIRHVDLRGCSRLRGRCFKLFGADLEEVLLDGCFRIDDEVIEDICLRSSNVHKLSLSDCSKLSDESLSAMSRHLSELRSVALCGERFPRLTTTGMLDLAKIGSLESIAVDYNPLITDDWLKALSSGVPSLRSLSLAFAGDDATVTSDGLFSLAALSQLKELDLSGLIALNNDALKTIVAGCTQLEKLVARSCTYLGDEGVEALMRLKQLTYLDLSGCILVTSKPIQEFVNAFKSEGPPSDQQQHITVVVGGTICEPHQIRIRNSRVNVDFSDYSSLNLAATKRFVGQLPTESGDDAESTGDVSDDEFGILSAHRSFIVDALNSEDDSPLENDRSVLEWAEREAAELGLLAKPSKS